jgi:hypothetical protein
MDPYPQTLGCGERDSDTKFRVDWSSPRVFLGVLAYRQFQNILHGVEAWPPRP